MQLYAHFKPSLLKSRRDPFGALPAKAKPAVSGRDSQAPKTCLRYRAYALSLLSDHSALPLNFCAFCCMMRHSMIHTC